MKCVLKVNKLSYKIGNIPILDDVSLCVPAGKICALLGKNGAGKTTLIKCLLGLIRNYSGNIQLNGISAKQNFARSQIAYIPEKENLGSASICDFLVQQASYAGIDKKEALKRILALCLKLDFPSERIETRMKILSSGLKKIILIMQAFITNAKLIIADEPTTNLDFETRILFYKLVRECNKKGMTFLISSHDLFEIKNFANFYVQIKHGKISRVSNTPPPSRIF